MIGLTLIASVCLQYAYSHTVVRHFTRMLELNDKVRNDWIQELAYNTYVGCAGLCFKEKSCKGFSFCAGVCYTHNTYVPHTPSSLHLPSPGMKTFAKKAQCVSPYRQMEDTCIWVSTTAVNNTEARSKCQMDGGDLVTLPSIDKIQLLDAFMVANGFDVGSRRSVGAYLDVATLTWNWLDGSGLTSSSRWCDEDDSGHPLVLPSEPCLQLQSSCFKDFSCTATYEYICEITL